MYSALQEDLIENHNMKKHYKKHKVTIIYLGKT